MAKIWTICGAARGVGKTRLCKKLCSLLSNSVYVKQGHGAQKTNKPENFFHSLGDLKQFIQEHKDQHDHIVIESNAFVYEKQSDIVIYVEARSNQSDLRPDKEQLENLADMTVIFKEEKK